MTALRDLLRGGLRLASLRAPRRTPLDAGAGHWLALVLLGFALDAALQWSLFDPPREPSPWGVQSALAATLLRLAACAVLCALTGRRALLWAVAGWVEVALLPVSAVVGGLYLVAAAREDLALHVIGYWIGLLWLLLILLRLAGFLHPQAVTRALFAALLGWGVIVAPWQWMSSEPWWFTREHYDEEEFASEYVEPGTLAQPEVAMYAQPEQLQRALDALAPQRPERIDLFALAFGGDASENVFRNEVEYVMRLMPQRFDADGHTLALLNHPDTAARWPLATATNLERALQGLGAHMDPAQDILFLYLTSHGSAEHELLVNQPPLPLDQLTPQRLRAALDASGIRWRVLVVSACYSGGYLDALRAPDTLVLTAARADRTSFGCGADSDITWFGKAFLADALNHSVDFVAAFAQARAQVAEWEKAEEFEPSEPQIDEGEAIGAQLQRWREGFAPGPALAFVPAAKAGDGSKGFTRTGSPADTAHASAEAQPATPADAAQHIAPDAPAADADADAEPRED